MDNQFEGLKVEGAMIAKFSADKRYATIVALPRYEDVPDFNDATKKKRKLIVQVELSNGSRADYYPNNTSSKVIANICGTDFNTWLGVRITWTINQQKVGQNMKDVLYVTDVILPIK